MGSYRLPSHLAAASLIAALWLYFGIGHVASAAAADGGHGLELTPLDHYVRAPDSNYRYKILEEVEGEGYRTYILHMVSQQWLTEAEVNLPIWEHYMTVTVPDQVLSDISFLFITGGSKTNAAPTGPENGEAERALLTGTVVSTLYMVPNQPLEFTDEPGLRRSEDSIIAYTWNKFFLTGDAKWPLRLPMTKAAVRAIDTITDLMASERAGAIEVDQFVVAGGSKRGWTAWMTAAVDGRVVAVIPIVIDLLNVGKSFKHHFSVYGAYSPAVFDYVVSGAVNWNGTPEWDALMDIVEPYEYRDRLSLPKYLLNSTGDEFFLPDSWQFYWDELVGEKHLRYVPNSNHGMGGTDVIDSVNAWYHAIVHNVTMPRYGWHVAEDGTITVNSLDEPTQVLLWQAHNPESRNFTQAVIGRAYQSTPLKPVAEGVYQVRVQAPEEGYTAYYVEIEFPGGTELPLKFSSGVKIVPNVREFEWEVSPESSRR